MRIQNSDGMLTMPPCRSTPPEKLYSLNIQQTQHSRHSKQWCGLQANLGVAIKLHVTETASRMLRVKKFPPPLPRL